MCPGCGRPAGVPWSPVGKLWHGECWIKAHPNPQPKPVPTTGWDEPYKGWMEDE